MVEKLPTTETKSAFARRIGIHKSNVTRAAQDGRIVLTADGRVDIAASLARWNETKGGRSDVEARHAENRGSVMSEPQPTTENRTAARFGATGSATVARLFRGAGRATTGSGVAPPAGGGVVAKTGGGGDCQCRTHSGFLDLKSALDDASGRT